MPKSQGKSHSFLVLKGRQNWETYTFFGKELFLQVLPGHKKKSFLITPRQSFCWNLIFFLSLSEKPRRKFIKASEKLFSSKCSSGHCNAVSTLLLFCLLLQSTFSSVQTSKKNIKVYPLQQNYFYYFSSQCFLDTRIALLATPPKQIAKLQTFFHSEFQTGRKKIIVSKKNFIVENDSRDAWNAVLTACRKILMISEFYLLKFGKREENCKR